MEINRHAVVGFLRALYKDVEKNRGNSNHVDFETMTSILECIDAVSVRISHRSEFELVLIKLPELGKLFDKGLSSRFVEMKDVRSLGGKSFVKLFSTIWDSQSGKHSTLVTASAIFFARQFFYLFKKVNLPCPQQAVEDAVNEYVEIESGLREPSGSWNNDVWLPIDVKFADDPETTGTHPRARRLWGIVDSVFNIVTPNKFVEERTLLPKHGPGAVADMKSGGDKYAFPHWPEKLDQCFQYVMFAQHRTDLHITEEMTSIPNPKEPPARLIAVPKTYKGPRLIASEPIAHQFLQQGLMHWIRLNMNPMLRASVSFVKQDYSRTAAISASRAGDLATVDLSSASDRLSCWTVERAFKSNPTLLRALHACRTRCFIDATGTDANLSMRMKKFAAQGSAVTFPVQTIIYAGLAISAILFYEHMDPTPRNIRRVVGRVRVFGDDIILPRSCVAILTLMLNSLQLKVNVGKTHASGYFRESCGADGYIGYDVTPIYVHDLEWDKSPEKATSFIKVCNNFYAAGLWEISKYMEDSIPIVFRKKSLTTRFEGDGYRFFTFCRGYSTQAKVRFSQKLHRDEAKVFASRSIVAKKNRGSWNDFYQYLIEAPNPQSKWSSGYITRKTSRIREVWVPIDCD